MTTLDSSRNYDLPKYKLNPKLNDADLYVPSEGLWEAMKVAITLGQPLLLTGEPGTGKTEFAKFIAHELKLGDVEVFNAQTTSQARDLFYRYDALAHFQFAQTQKEALNSEFVFNQFIELRGLGKAIEKKDKQSVVLMDEIDKAPRDFPNDILAAIESLRFRIHEVSKEFETTVENRPIVIITSNSEKNLPDAFLRRVIYYHIDFPNADELLRILASKIDGYDETALEALIAHFEKIRAKNMVKKPATAELINWAFYLQQMGFPAGKINGTLADEDKKLLQISYSVLAKNRNDLENMRKMIA